MIIYVCESCGCEVKKKKPDICPLCKKHGTFSEYERPDPDDADKKSSEKYKKALKTLEEYSEGCEPEPAKYHFEE